MSCTISDHTSGDSCYYFNLHSMVLVGAGACSPKVQVKCNGNCNNNNYSQLHITVTLDCCCGLLPQRTRLQITLIRVRVFGPHPGLIFRLQIPLPSFCGLSSHSLVQSLLYNYYGPSITDIIAVRGQGSLGVAVKSQTSCQLCLALNLHTKHPPTHGL